MFGFAYKNRTLFNIFLAIVAFSFILGTAIMWGPGGFSALTGSYLLKVGDITVTPKEFLIELYQLQRQYPNFSKEQLKNIAKEKVLLESVLAYFAYRDGFYVSKEEIAQFIRNMFRSKDGQFDPNLFKEYLKRLNMSPAEFESYIRRILLASKYKTAVFSDSYANEAVVKALILPFELQLKVSVYKLTPQLVEDHIKVSPEEVKDFYSLYKEQFVKEIPPKVEVFVLPTKEGVKKLYSEWEKGKISSFKPSFIVSQNQQEEVKEYKNLVKEAFQKKTLVVKETPQGYAVAVYLPGEKEILPLPEVYKQIENQLKLEKALKLLPKEAEKYVNLLKEGKKVNLPKEEKTLSGFELMKLYGLDFDAIEKLLGGERFLIGKTSNGVVIIEVQQLGENTEDLKKVEVYYKAIARQDDYRTKLQQIINYYWKKGEIPIKFNDQLFKQL
jgi:hypothetical protein